MALTEIPSELSSTPSIVDNGNATAITIGSDESATFAGSVSISHGAGDSLTLTKTTTEPSLRLEGDTNKDFVITVSGELLTITQNDGSTDLLTLDHDTKGATFSSTVTATGLTVNTDANSSVVIKDVGTNAIAMYAAAGDELYLGGNNTYSLRLKTDGNVAMDNGGNLSFSAGHGIDFSANANAGGCSSELLDDYEEGTWTPVIKAVGTGGNNASYTLHGPTYTKVGRLVNVQVYISGINLNTITAGSYVTLQGFPFACTNYADFTIAYKSGSWATSGNIIGGYMQSGASYAYFMRANGTEAQQGSTDLELSKAMINITYQAS